MTTIEGVYYTADDGRKYIHPEAIRWARQQRGHSQERMAKHIGVHRITIANWERGHKRCSPVPMVRKQVLTYLVESQRHHDRKEARERTLDDAAAGSDTHV